MVAKENMCPASQVAIAGKDKEACAASQVTQKTQAGQCQHLRCSAGSILLPKRVQGVADRDVGPSFHGTAVTRSGVRRCDENRKPAPTKSFHVDPQQPVAGKEGKRQLNRSSSLRDVTNRVPSTLAESTQARVNACNAEPASDRRPRIMKGIFSAHRADAVEEDAAVNVKILGVNERSAEVLATTAEINGRPILPPHLIARILDMAGLVDETPESAYLGDTLRRDLTRELSRSRHPVDDWLVDQPEVDARMRAMLVDWISEVHASYRLQRRTLFLAISILDRYLAARLVSKLHLQLIGACALLIAAKMEDVQPLAVRQLRYLCAGRYSDEDFFDTECEMLSILGFAIETPTVADFLPHVIAVYQARANTGGELNVCGADPAALARRYSALTSEADARRNNLAWRLAELSLLDVEVAGFAPSQVAAAALLLSNRLLGRRESWPVAWVELLGYPDHSSEECVSTLNAQRLAISTPSNQFLATRFRDISSLYAE